MLGVVNDWGVVYVGVACWVQVTAAGPSWAEAGQCRALGSAGRWAVQGAGQWAVPLIQACTRKACMHMYHSYL